jgi:hypothetical protein
MDVHTHIIVYPAVGGGLCFCYPGDCGLSLQEIARKDVPAETPFLFVARAELPEDPTYMAAWTADFSAPHGYGIGPTAWFAEQAGAN